MQQTQTYKLNLIETSDTFSPAPLNENMEKVEAQFSAEAAARQSGDAALAQRVATLECHKIAAGIYTGNGSYDDDATWLHVSLGFTPIFVYVQTPGGSVPTSIVSGGRHNYLLIEEGGFKVRQDLDRTNGTYNFFAIL